jgi:ubiquitin-like protein Pup
MSEQERIQKQRAERSKPAAAEVSVDATKGEQLKADLDELLDEIDEVLEENAEEFVRNYVQKGGQ